MSDLQEFVLDTEIGGEIEKAIMRSQDVWLDLEDVVTIMAASDVLPISDKPCVPDHEGLYLYHKEALLDNLHWDEYDNETTAFQGAMMLVQTVSTLDPDFIPDQEKINWRKTYNHEGFQFCLVQYKLSYNYIDQAQNGNHEDAEDNHNHHHEEEEVDHEEGDINPFDLDVHLYRQQQQNQGSNQVAPQAAAEVSDENFGLKMELALIVDFVGNRFREMGVGVEWLMREKDDRESEIRLLKGEASEVLSMREQLRKVCDETDSIKNGCEEAHRLKESVIPLLEKESNVEIVVGRLRSENDRLSLTTKELALLDLVVGLKKNLAESTEKQINQKIPKPLAFDFLQSLGLFYQLSMWVYLCLRA
ncbi:unnamed protein product, partial [Thlaspi arvense]